MNEERGSVCVWHTERGGETERKRERAWERLLCYFTAFTMLFGTTFSGVEFNTYIFVGVGIWWAKCFTITVILFYTTAIMFGSFNNIIVIVMMLRGLVEYCKKYMPVPLSIVLEKKFKLQIKQTQYIIHITLNLANMICL